MPGCHNPVTGPDRRSRWQKIQSGCGAVITGKNSPDLCGLDHNRDATVQVSQQKDTACIWPRRHNTPKQSLGINHSLPAFNPMRLTHIDNEGFHKRTTAIPYHPTGDIGNCRIHLNIQQRFEAGQLRLKLYGTLFPLKQVGVLYAQALVLIKDIGILVSALNLPAGRRDGS